MAHYTLELHYTLDRESAVIAAGRQEQDRSESDPIFLPSEGGVLVALSARHFPGDNPVIALEAALAIARADLTYYAPKSAHVPDYPWSVRIVESDGMVENLLQSDWIDTDFADFEDDEDGNEAGDLVEVNS